MSAAALLQRNLIVYGLGGIKLIDRLITALHLA